MTTLTPSREQQTRAALQRANEVRYAASAIRRAVQAGTITVRQALLDPKAGPLRVEQLIASQHRWGTKRTNDALGRANITPGRRVRDLTDRQLHVLAETIENPDAIDEAFTGRSRGRRLASAAA